MGTPTNYKQNESIIKMTNEEIENNQKNNGTFCGGPFSELAPKSIESKSIKTPTVFELEKRY